MPRGRRPTRSESNTPSARPIEETPSRRRRTKSPRRDADEAPSGFYADLCTAEELDDLTAALGNLGLDDEIALLKVLIRRAVAAGAGAHTIIPAVNALVRALKVRHALRGQEARNLDEALSQALTEIGDELGIGT